jgi:hypothetical protein
MEPYLLVTGIVVSVLIWAYISLQMDKTRSVALAQVAQRLGLRYEEFDIVVARDSPGLAEFILDLTKDNDGWVKNFMIGKIAEIAVAIFDYTYHVGFNRSRRDYDFTKAYLYSSSLDLPLFMVFPGAAPKVGFFTGLVRGPHEFKMDALLDIEISNAPNFTKHFTLQGEDKNEVISVFTPEVRTFFEHHAGVYAEGNGHTLLIYYPYYVQADRIRDFINDCYELVEVLLGRVPHGIGEDAMESGTDQTAQVEHSPISGILVMGQCPNCESKIPVSSLECPHCKALFGVNSSWRVLPLR